MAMQLELEKLVGRWEIDSTHSGVEFSVRHMMVSTVRGRFDDLAGSFVITEEIPSSSAEVTVRVAGISTHDPERDEHLRSADFLDVEQYPDLVFRGNPAAAPDADGRFALVGDMTIRGVTRLVEFQCTVDGYTPSDTKGL